MRHRYATQDDVAQWFEGRVPSTMRALVIEDGGEVIAIAGLAPAGAFTQAFSDVKPAARRHPIALGRMVDAFRQMMDSVAGPVMALCNADEPTAPGLLRHLGFEQQDDAIWRRG
jgi:hypothetical protein